MRKVLLLLLLIAASAHAEKTLRWKQLAVTAQLDRDGTLHVQERHSIIFNGDWNGAERTFRSGAEDVIKLQRISRDGVPLRYDKSISGIDTYAWHDSNTLRWRSRLPSDPPFQAKEITYEIDYTDSYILRPKGEGSYLIDHNFGLPDLQWPIDKYSLDLTFDPIWQPATPQHIERSNLPRGVNFTITLPLRYLGTSPPAAVNIGAPAPARGALIAVLLGGAALFAFLFIRRERSVGRLQPLPGPVDRQFLEEHVLKFLPEVVGAAWDDRTGAAEVAAVIARMVHEGKLSSRVDKGGLLSPDNLVLELLADRKSLPDYEKTLVNAMFVSGDKTSTKEIRKYYRAKKKPFNPAGMIRAPLQKRLRAIGKSGGAPAIDWKPTAIFSVIGVALLAAGGFFGGPLNILAAAIASGAIIAFYIFGVIGAFDYRRRLIHLGISAIEFVPQILLLVVVPIVALKFRLTFFTLSGVTLLALAAIRSVFNLAMSRDGGERLENRRRLAAAREYFARELRRPNPALDDAWFPYVLAFGLGKNVDRWFRSFGVTSGASTSTFSRSSTSGTTGWTGGGGAFGGAGASGGWAVAAAGMAAGVSAASGSGGGGVGGGGSSGGGGGGGW